MILQSQFSPASLLYFTAGVRLQCLHPAPGLFSARCQGQLDPCQVAKRLAGFRLLHNKPSHFELQGLEGVQRYFAMARGFEDKLAMDMSKFFDTNYHYLVRWRPYALILSGIFL